MNALLEYIYNPRRLHALAQALAMIGGLMLVAGAVGTAARTILGVVQRSSSRAVPQTLAELLPTLPTWWIPETIIGLLPALCLIAGAFWVAMLGRQLQRTYFGR